MNSNLIFHLRGDINSNFGDNHVNFRTLCFIYLTFIICLIIVHNNTINMLSI